MSTLPLGTFTVFGDNPELLSARERMPEPSRVEQDYWRVPLPRDHFCFVEHAAYHPLKTADFRKAWMVSEGGCRFLAWVSVEDGKVYI